LADENRYYETLGVDQNASDEDIRKAYRKLVFLYHPDRNPGDADALEKFRLISEAYQYLSNQERKTQAQDYNNDGLGSKSGFAYRPTEKAHAEPRCPGCSVTGLEHISARNGGASSSAGKQFISSPFVVVFCDNCGHIYTVTNA